MQWCQRRHLKLHQISGQKTSDIRAQNMANRGFIHHIGGEDPFFFFFFFWTSPFWAPVFFRVYRSLGDLFLSFGGHIFGDPYLSDVTGGGGWLLAGVFGSSGLVSGLKNIRFFSKKHQIFISFSQKTSDWNSKTSNLMLNMGTGITDRMRLNRPTGVYS